MEKNLEKKFGKKFEKNFWKKFKIKFRKKFEIIQSENEWILCWILMSNWWNLDVKHIFTVSDCYILRKMCLLNITMFLWWIDWFFRWFLDFICVSFCRLFQNVGSLKMLVIDHNRLTMLPDKFGSKCQLETLLVRRFSSLLHTTWLFTLFCH